MKGVVIFVFDSGGWIPNGQWAHRAFQLIPHVFRGLMIPNAVRRIVEFLQWLNIQLEQIGLRAVV